MFLTARRFMYQQVYFHRTVRAIDLDLAEVFGPSVRAIFGDGSPADRLAAYADLDEYALLHQAARWARGIDVDARVPATVAFRFRSPIGWRAILLRQPTWRAEAEVRAEYEAGGLPDALVASLGGRSRGVAIDLAIVDARPDDPARDRRPLALEGRDGRRCAGRQRSAPSRPTGSSAGATGGAGDRLEPAGRTDAGGRRGRALATVRRGLAPRRRGQDEQRVDPGDLRAAASSA